MADYNIFKQVDCIKLVMIQSSHEFNDKQNARIDEWLMLCQQSNIEYGSKQYAQILTMMGDDDQIVIDTVISTLASSVTLH